LKKKKYSGSLLMMPECFFQVCWFLLSVLGSDAPSVHLKQSREHSDLSKP